MTISNYKTPLPKDVKLYLDKLKETISVINYERILFIKYIEYIFQNEELYYSEEKIEKYFSYEKYLNYPGKEFHLYPWERCLFVLHFCVYRKDGLPRFPDLDIIGGRGMGKNGFITFEILCAISPNHGIHEYDVSICSVSEQNAKTSFMELYNAFEYASPENKAAISAHFKWTLTTITCIDTNSKVIYRTSNAKSADGGKEGMVVFDEYHQYQNYDLVDVFTTGLGKKAHPRKAIVTTDGFVRGGPLDDLKERIKLILNFEMPDNGHLPYYCKLDNESEVDNEKMWQKANPSLEYSVNLYEEIKKEYFDYKINPISSLSFIVKRMNIPKEKTEEQVTSWDNILKTWKITNGDGKEVIRDIPDLKGKKCVCGIDFTKRNDFLGASLVFYEDELYYSLNHTWVCRNSADWDRFTSKIDIYSWEAAGLLTIVDQPELDPDLVCEWIKEQQKNYKIIKVAIDDYRYDFLKRSLREIYFSDKDIYHVRPSDIMKVVEKIGTAFARALIVWGNNPLMRWATNNTKLVPSKNNNFVYGKIEEKSRKTDPFMAFAMAMCIVEILFIKNYPRRALPIIRGR